MAPVVDRNAIEGVADILIDQKRPLKERFRALFTLKNLGGQQAIDCMCRCFSDPSELLKHEVAYCLGQMQDEAAIPALTEVLKDNSQQAIVRHEAGEALGAIGKKDVLNLLEEYANDPVVEVAETCQLAVNRIRWLQSDQSVQEKLGANPYMSVDPAPPSVETDITSLKSILLDEKKSLFSRYRAMFSLRNNGSEEAILALAEGLKSHGALFRHEIAYVLGQVQHPAAVQQLKHNLCDSSENAMVRHECAEALGSIATEECTTILDQYLKDDQRVVKESCEVALDMCEYETSQQFQYADGLNKVKGSL